MECERVQDLLSEFLEGTMPEKERAGVAAHLRSCGTCANAAEGLENTIRMLRNLTPEKAPPELLEKIRMETARHAPEKADLWKRLFLPAHVKIPIEAAAVVLLVLLGYGIQQKEKPPLATLLPPPRTESSPAASKTADPAKKDAAIPKSTSHADKVSSSRLRESPPEPGPRVATRETLKRSAAPETLPSSGREPSQQPDLPAVPAKRVSTLAERIEPSYPRGDAAGKELPIRMLAAPPARLIQPHHYGRDVTLEVPGESISGLEERIVEAARRVGGNLFRGREYALTGSIPEAGPPGTVRVRIPAETAEIFLSDLRSFGTIPAEGEPASADIPGGPAPGFILYTVRISVR